MATSIALVIDRLSPSYEHCFMAKTKRNFSDMDRKAAVNLAEIYERKKKGLELNQEKLAFEVDMTQGAVSQYLKGKVPLRIVAALKFAKALKVKPTEIREDLAELTSELPIEAIEFAQKYANMTPEQQRKFEAILLLAGQAAPDSKLAKDWHAPDEPEPTKPKRRRTAKS